MTKTTCRDCFYLAGEYQPLSDRPRLCLRIEGDVRRRPSDPSCEKFKSRADGNQAFSGAKGKRTVRPNRNSSLFGLREDQ